MTTRASPVRDRLIGILRDTPRGLTTKQFVGTLWDTPAAANFYLSRAANYGWITRVQHRSADTRSAHEWNTWSLPE